MTVDYFIRRYESDRAAYAAQLNFLEVESARSRPGIKISRPI